MGLSKVRLYITLYIGYIYILRISRAYSKTIEHLLALIVSTKLLSKR